MWRSAWFTFRRYAYFSSIHVRTFLYNCANLTFFITVLWKHRLLLNQLYKEDVPPPIDWLDQSDLWYNVELIRLHGLFHLLANTIAIEINSDIVKVRFGFFPSLLAKFDAVKVCGVSIYRAFENFVSIFDSTVWNTVLQSNKDFLREELVERVSTVHQL